MVKRLGRKIDLVMALMSEKKTVSRKAPNLVETKVHGSVPMMVPMMVPYLVQMTAHYSVPMMAPKMDQYLEQR